jgi:Mn-dependent DtxR family transcriptional regulator
VVVFFDQPLVSSGSFSHWHRTWSLSMPDSFYRIRRAFRDEVLFDTNLSSPAVSVAFAIAQMADRETGECFPDPSTLAKRFGVKRNRIVKAIEELKNSGHLEITLNVGAKNSASRGRTVYKLKRTFESPSKSMSGTKRYYEEQGECIEHVLWDNAPSPTQKRIAFCIIMFTDLNGWCNEGARDIAELIGVSHPTVGSAINLLADNDYLDLGYNEDGSMYYSWRPPELASKPLASCTTRHHASQAGKSVVNPQRDSSTISVDPGKSLVNGQRGSLVESNTSNDISVIPVSIIPTNTQIPTVSVVSANAETTTIIERAA